MFIMRVKLGSTPITISRGFFSSKHHGWEMSVSNRKMKGGMCTGEATKIWPSARMCSLFKSNLTHSFLCCVFSTTCRPFQNVEVASSRFLSSLPGKLFFILQQRVESYGSTASRIQNCDINCEIRILASLGLLLISYIESYIILMLEDIILSLPH